MILDFFSHVSVLQGLGATFGVGQASCCFSLMAYWVVSYTDATVPFWDAMVCAFAWAGMWLMAKRKIENWVYLNISNFMSVPLLIHKGLYIYAVLTAFLFLVAISGYIKWKANLDKNTEIRHA